MVNYMTNNLRVEIDDEAHGQYVCEDEDCYHKELVLRCICQVIKGATGQKALCNNKIW
jgi:hypothetical protein